ncbi:COPII-coated vesicle protein [Savitreella phatthalungensis]
MFNRLFHHLVVVMFNMILIFVQVYFAVQFSDLGSDYVNPIDLCRDLNRFMLPEASAQALITLVLLVLGRWGAFLLNLPVLVWNLRKYANKEFTLDPTEIFRTYQKYKREAFFKLIFYLCMFFCKFSTCHQSRATPPGITNTSHSLHVHDDLGSHSPRCTRQGPAYRV